MNVSAVYERFSPTADALFRRAMALAGRHRVLRVHHLIAACREEDALIPASWGDKRTVQTLAKWTAGAREYCGQDPAGCLDAPMSNSPTMRRVLSLAADRAGHEVFPILPAHLIAMAICCWNEEQPPGPQLAVRVRCEVRRLCLALGVEPLPAFQLQSEKPAKAASSIAGSAAGGLLHVPTVEELEALIGPAVTSDDLISLYMEMKAASDPAERERLARKLEYLRDRG